MKNVRFLPVTHRYVIVDMLHVMPICCFGCVVQASSQVYMCRQTLYYTMKMFAIDALMHGLGACEPSCQ